MPERKKGEPLKGFVSRCIRQRRHEHPDEKHTRSIAACYSMGREWWKRKK